MKNLLKRSLSLLLALVMILGMLPANVLTVHAEETTDDPHSLKYADGIVWLVKSKTGSYSQAFEDKIVNGELSAMIRDSVPGTNGTEKVLFDGVDIGNMLEVTLMGKLEALRDGLVAAVTNHELVTFNIGGVDRKIAFRNVLTVNINIPDVVIESIGEPGDLQEQIANAINNPNITISHIDEISIEKAGALVETSVVDSYSWPNPGDEDVEVGWITVRIFADDVTPENWMNYPEDYPNEEAFLAEGCKVVTGKIILRESRDLFDVSIISNGEVLVGKQIPEFDPMPEFTVSDREYYYFYGWEVVDAVGNKTELKAEEGKTPEEILPEQVLQSATYTAIWKPHTDNAPNGQPDGVADEEQSFTVTFTDGVGGKVFADEVSTLLYGTATPVFEPTRTYYKFLGWLKNDATEAGAADATVTDHVTYTAVWAPERDTANGDGIADEEQKFTVTFKDGAEGKVFADYNYNLLWGSETPVPPHDRQYYEFLGWQKEGEEGYGDVDATVSDDVTYIAQWKPYTDNAPNGQPDGIADEEQSFTITYTDGVNGDAFADVVHTVAYGKTTPFYQPEREYYTFNGWSPEVAKNVTDNATYVAQWKPIRDVNKNEIADEEETFTITFEDGEGGRFFATKTYRIKWGEATPLDSEVLAEVNNVAQYYKFNGWSTSVSWKVTNDATYVANKWTPKVDNNTNGTADQEEEFVIEFYLNKGDEKPYATVTTNGGVLTSSIYPAAPSQDGWKFAGWQTDDGKRPADMVFAHVKYYATWTNKSVVTYTIYYWNDTPTVFTLAVDETTGLAQLPPDIGDTDTTIWTPWYTINDQDEQVAFDFSKPVGGDINLYSRYESDANGNGSVDGAEDDPFLRYIFMHKNGTVMEERSSYKYEEDESPVSHPDSNDDDVVFIGWTETKTTTEENGVYTETHVFTPNFADDRNNNGEPDEGEKLYHYVFVDSLNVEIPEEMPDVNSQLPEGWLGYEIIIKGESIPNGNAYINLVTLAPGEVFVRWEGAETPIGKDILLLHYPVKMLDRNCNGLEDGVDEPYIYYVVEINGETVDQWDWLAGEPVVKPEAYNDRVALGEYQKILEWKCTETTRDDGSVQKLYTPVVITDRNGNNKHDGSQEDPYTYYLFRMARTVNGEIQYKTEKEFAWLSGDDEVVPRLVARPVDTTIFEVASDWVEEVVIGDDEYTTYKTYTSTVIIDENGNGKYDGTAEDPYTYYLFQLVRTVDGETKYETVKEKRWLTGMDEIDPNKVNRPVNGAIYEVAGEWEEEVTIGDDGHTVYKTYTATVIVDKNGNGADDVLETDKINVPLDEEKFVGFEANLEDGKFIISGTKDDETYTGTVTVTDANGKSILTAEGTFTYDDNTVIKATPLWNEDQTKMIGYVAGIKVNGEELLPYYLDYMASNKPVAEVALMMMAAPIAEEDGHMLEVIYEPVVMTEKNPHDVIELGKSSYTQNEIYNAMISTPVWDSDDLNEFITVEYKARNASKEGQTIPLSYVYTKVPGNLVETAKSLIGDSVPVSWGESWKPVDADVTVESVDSIVIDFVDKLWAKYDNNPSANDLMQIGQKIKNELPKEVAARAGYHLFATNPDGRTTNDKGLEVIPEDVRITYKDPQGRYFVELSTKAKLEETRKDTYITVPTDKGDVTFVYGEFTSEQLLDLVALYDEDDKPVSGKLELDHYKYHANGVNEEGYTVTVSYAGNDLYKPCSNTFKIYITKSTPKITIENIEVQQGETYDPTPVVVPEAAEIVHVIAGIELSQLNIDLLTGVVTNKDAGNLPVKAWIDLPFMYEDIIKNLLKFDDNFYTMEAVKEKISQSEVLADKLQPALDQIDTMMDEIEVKVVESLGVNVEFTMMISFQDRGKPTESGFYLNYAQIMDTTNYNETTAYGTLMITPMYAMPNSGVELVYKDVEDNQNLFTFEHDGSAKTLKVVHEGKYVDAEIKYYGLTTRADVTNDAPKNPGVYVVTAIYTTTNEEDGSITLVGSDVALAFINLTKANIEVDNMSVVYDGTTAWYPEIVIKDASGKNIGGGMTVISGTVNDDEDGKAIDLEDITGNVNIDFPADLDNAWKKFCDVMKIDISGKVVHPSDVVEFLNWYNAQIDDKAKTVTDLLAKLTVNGETTQKALDMAKAASNALKAEVEKLPENVSVSFYNKDELKYIETGAYLFVGVITDPELLPDVNAGLLVVKSADAFEMYDTYVPYNDEEQNITVDDTTSRDNVTLIVDRKHNQVNFILDQTMFNLVDAALTKAGYTVYKGSDVVAEAAYVKGNAVADTLTDVIIDYIEQTATDKIKNKFPASSDELDRALAAMDARLGNLQNKLSARLQEIDKINDETIIVLNGKLPVDAGEYKFYGFDYDVAYTSATLYIEPIHIMLDVNESAKVYKEENPEFIFEPSYYSYEGVAPSNKSEVNVELPANAKLDDLIDYSFECAVDVNSKPGEYDITLSASLKDTSGNYVLDTKTDVDTLYVNPLEIIVAATVNPNPIKVGDKATVTVEVTDTKGNKLNVAGDFSFDETTGLERDDFVLTAVEEGEYTIVPSPVDPEGYYDVTKVNNATLTVDNVDVTITAYVNGKGSATITYGEIPEIKVVAKGSDGKDYTDLLKAYGVITDAEGNEVDVDKLTVGTYKVVSKFTAVAGYNVDATATATLTVDNVDVTITAYVNGKSSDIITYGETPDIKVVAKGSDGKDYTDLLKAYGVITDAEGNEVDADKLTVGNYTVVPKFIAAEGCNVDDKTGLVSATLVVKPIEITVTAKLAKDEVIVHAATADEVGLTTVVTDANGKEITIDSLLTGKYEFSTGYNLDKALHMVGKHEIKPVYNELPGYKINVVSVTLTVHEVPENKYVIDFSDYEVGLNTADKPVIKPSVKLDGDPLGEDDDAYKALNPVVQLVKNGQAYTLDEAIAELGEYTITATYNDSVDYTVTVNEAKLNVVEPRLEVWVELNKTTDLTVLVGEKKPADIEFNYRAWDNIGSNEADLLGAYTTGGYTINANSLEEALNKVGDYTITPDKKGDPSRYTGGANYQISMLTVTTKKVIITPVLKLDRSGKIVSNSSVTYGDPSSLVIDFDYETPGWNLDTADLEELKKNTEIERDFEIDPDELFVNLGCYTFTAALKNGFDVTALGYEVVLKPVTLNVVSVQAAASFNPTVGGNSVFTGTQNVTVGGAQVTAHNISYGADAEAVYTSLDLKLRDDHGNPVPVEAIAQLKVKKVDAVQVARMSLRSARATNIWDSLKVSAVGVYEVTTVISDTFLNDNPQYSSIAPATAYLVVEPVDVKVYATVKDGDVTTAATAEDVGLNYAVKDTEGNVIDDHGVTVEFKITDSNGKEVTLADALKVEGTYTITPVVKSATNQNYNVLTDVGTETLTVDDIDVTITVKLSKDSVRIIDNETVTVTIESSVDVTGLLNGYTIDGIEDFEGDKALEKALQSAGTYTIRPKYNNVPGYDVTGVGTAKLEVKNAKAVVTPVLTPNAVNIPDNTPVELTYKVEIDGVEVEDHGLTINAPTIAGVAGVDNLATALKTAGEYTIIPNVEAKHGYSIELGNAKLEVKKAATEITITIGKSEFTYGEVKSIDELNITVTANDNRLTNIGFIIKDSNGNVVTPEFALNNAGEYTIYPDTSAFDDAYDVTYTPVKFTVKRAEITVAADVQSEYVLVNSTENDVKLTFRVTDSENTEYTEESDVYKAVFGGKYTITDSEGNTVADLATALSTVGTYTITPDTLESNAYDVVAVNAALNVIDPKIASNVTSLSLEGVVYMEYMLHMSGFPENYDFEKNGGVVIWTGDVAPTKPDQLYIDAENCTTQYNMYYSTIFNCWAVQSLGVNAKAYGDKIYMKAFVKVGDQIVYGPAVMPSPMQYCYSVLSQTGDDPELLKAKATCAALLEYGTAAQKLFDYDLNNLVNYRLTDDDRQRYNLVFADSMIDNIDLPTMDKVNTLTGIRDYGISSGEATLSLLGAIQIELGFDIAIENIDYAEVLVWTEAAYNAATTLAYEENTYSYKVPLKKGTFLGRECYTASSRLIKAKEIGDTLYFSVRVTDKNGNVYRGGLGCYSPDYYVGQHKNHADPEIAQVVRTLAVYSEKARILFNYLDN